MARTASLGYLLTQLFKHFSKLFQGLLWVFFYFFLFFTFRSEIIEAPKMASWLLLWHRLEAFQDVRDAQLRAQKGRGARHLAPELPRLSASAGSHCVTPCRSDRWGVPGWTSEMGSVSQSLGWAQSGKDRGSGEWLLAWLFPDSAVTHFACIVWGFWELKPRTYSAGIAG